MPCNCSVLNCRSRFSQVDEGVFFHRFPKDKTLRRKWTEACGVPSLNTDNARVCSLHFQSSDFQRHLKYELLGQPVPKNLAHLKDGVIPTLKLPSASQRPVEPAMAASTLLQSPSLGSQAGSPRSWLHHPCPVSGPPKADWRASFAKCIAPAGYRRSFSNKPSILRQHNGVWLPRPRTDSTSLDKADRPMPLSAKKKDANNSVITSPSKSGTAKMLRCHVCTSNVREEEYPNHLFFGSLRCELCSVVCQDCRVFQWLWEKVEGKTSDCQHRFVFCEDPYEYLLLRLCGSDDHDLDESSPLPHNIRVLQSYINKLETPYLRQPLKDALRKCKRNLLKAYRLKAYENSFPSPTKNVSQENSPPTSKLSGVSIRENQLHTTPTASEDVMTPTASEDVTTPTASEDVKTPTASEDVFSHEEPLPASSLMVATEDKDTRREGMDSIREERRESTPECARESPSPSLEGSCDDDDDESEDENEDESLLLTQSYDLEHLEQAVEYVELDMLTTKSFEMPSAENSDQVSEPKKRRKSHHKKAKRVFTRKRRPPPHPVEQEEEEEEEDLVLEKVETPETGYYLMVQQSVEECPMCYQSFDPTMCTVNTRTFLFTVHCPSCGLIIYMVPDLPDGLQIVTEDTSSGAVTAHTKAAKSTTR